MVDLRRARPALEVDDAPERNLTEALRGHRQHLEPDGVGAILTLGADAHVVLLALLLVGRHLVAVDEQAERSGRVGDRDPEVRGARTIDPDADLRLPGDERRVHVDRARDLA